MRPGNYFFPLYRKETIPFEGIASKSTAASRRLLLLPSRFSTPGTSLDEKLDACLSQRGWDGWWGCESRSEPRSASSVVTRRR